MKTLREVSAVVSIGVLMIGAVACGNKPANNAANAADNAQNIAVGADQAATNAVAEASKEAIGTNRATTEANQVKEDTVNARNVANTAEAKATSATN